MVEQSAIVFSTVVCGSGLLCLADLAKQIVFLLLKLVVAGLQHLSSIFSCFLLGQDRVVLCSRVFSFTLGLLLLFLICRVICSLLRRVRAAPLPVVMKSFLDFFREFGEVNLCDSRFRFDHDAVRLNAGDSRVFVFFAVNGFEVLRKCRCCKGQDQNCGKCCVHFLLPGLAFLFSYSEFVGQENSWASEVFLATMTIRELSKTKHFWSTSGWRNGCTWIGDSSPVAGST